MRKSFFLIVAMLAVGIGGGRTLADTGTYRILDYRVYLTPHADGVVEMTYYQKWQVTGGSIPWITVGLPSRGFEILYDKTSGAVRSIRDGSKGAWAGVRIDLDADYGPGRTFEIGFSIRQSGLLYADANNYRLDFSPGWYDRARIDLLQVAIFFFAQIDTITATPEPTRREGQTLRWEKRDLGPGDRLTVSVAFPKNLFPADVALGTKPSAGLVVPWFALIVVLLVAGLILYFMIRESIGWKYGRGGSIFFGGRGGSHVRGGGGGIFSGGGGGFGGSAASCVCACACAGCACACACAGGSAAGCDRKTDHTCPLCRCCEAAGCPFRRR